MQEHYENIAKIIVRANKIRQLEQSSAKNDFENYQDYLEKEAGLTDSFREDVNGNIREYSAYLNRKGDVNKIADDLTSEVRRTASRSKLISKLQDVFGKMGTEELNLKNAEKEHETAYERSRDEKDDYYYNWKNELEERYAAAKKKSTSSSSGKSSSSSKSKKKTTTVDNTKYIDLMPEFKSATGLTEGFTNDIYAKSFKDKALDLSANGTKKADVNEVNALLKLAEEYGASDEYLSWISAVCGYNGL